MVLWHKRCKDAETTDPDKKELSFVNYVKLKATEGQRTALSGRKFLEELELSLKDSKLL